MSRSYCSIWASARSRRPLRSARSSGRISVAIGAVRVVGERRVAVLCDNDDLLASIAAGAVLPDDGLEHEHHACGIDEFVVAFLAPIGSDHRHLGCVGADAMGQSAVRKPW